jgi:hypothetical protein
MTTEKELEDAVTAASSTVSDWRIKVASLEAQRAELDGVVTRAIASREGLALSALLGDSKAKGAIAAARTAQNLAEEELKDIGHALPAAKEALAAAEREEQATHVALSHYQAALLKRQRIGIAAKIDDAIAALLPLIQEFDDVGQQIANTPGLYAKNMFGSGMGQLDEIRGDRRLRAAISKRFEKIFPGAGFDEMRKEKLQDSEARVWSLPEPATKAA